jgi:uncharacterized phage protein gp47/JayE
MPFDRPTLSTLRRQLASDLAAGLPGDQGLLRYSNLGILGDGLAALVSGLYGYLDWIALQGVPFTAQDEYLEGWAALKGVIRKPATQATGTATFQGADGSEIPAGTPLLRADGAAFATFVAGTIAGGSTTVAVIASDAGAAGNTAAGATLALAVSRSGVVATAVVAAAIAGGTDVEADEDFRTRTLAIYAAPPQGGARADYVDWALEAPGVTRAWASPNGMGPGTVTVYFMMDEVEAAHDGFPQGTNGVATAETRDATASGDQLVVANAIYPVQPVTALVYAVAPGRNAVDFSIAGFLNGPAATKALIRQAIADALKVDAAPGGVTQLSLIEGAIARIPAAAGFIITAIGCSNGVVGPGAIGNVAASPGYLNALGAVSFV